jgi:hypothetical protein
MRPRNKQRHGRTIAVVSRLLLVIATLGLAMIVVRDGWANHRAQQQTTDAAAVSSGDARIAIGTARARLARGERPGSPPLQALVHVALYRDTTQPAPLEILALAAHRSGDRAQETRLFALSARLSQRSLATRLWLIQRSVARGDVAGALHDFDVALRTSSLAPPLLFPVLARAAADPALVGPIAQLLDRPSDWRAMFLHQAALQPETALAAARLLLAMHDRQAVIAAEIDQTVIAALVAGQQFVLARQVFSRFSRAGADGQGVLDGDFTKPALAYPFGWGLVDTGPLGAIRQSRAGRTVLGWHADPDQGGAVATQLLMLPPGRHVLATHITDAASDPAATPYWTLTCATRSNDRLGVLRLPGAGQTAGAAIVVPPDCPAQWLVLMIPAGDTTGDQSGTIAGVAVTGG